MFFLYINRIGTAPAFLGISYLELVCDRFAAIKLTGPVFSCACVVWGNKVLGTTVEAVGYLSKR